MDRKAIGARLYRLRAELGLSRGIFPLRNVAQHTGFSEDTIDSIERGTFHSDDATYETVVHVLVAFYHANKEFVLKGVGHPWYKAVPIVH